MFYIYVVYFVFFIFKSRCRKSNTYTENAKKNEGLRRILITHFLCSYKDFFLPFADIFAAVLVVVDRFSILRCFLFEKSLNEFSFRHD